MKALLAMLALLSLPCMAQEHLLDMLKQDAKLSGTIIGWELDVDFELNPEQLKVLAEVQKGRTILLADKAIDLVRKGGYTSQLEPGEWPVVFACAKSRSVVVTTERAGKWLEGRCALVTQR
jgi:hypothetical protein